MRAASSTSSPAPDWHSGVYHQRHHFLAVNAGAETMTITAIGDDNINIKGVSEKDGVGGPNEILETITIKRRSSR